MIGKTLSRAARMIMTPEAVRERCEELFKVAETNELNFFSLDLAALDYSASCVIKEMQRNYPHGVVPFHSRWRHFELMGKDLWSAIVDRHQNLSRDELARARIDLAVFSVLVDAGAGPKWIYRDAITDLNLGRSEGLALASLRIFEAGTLSSHGSEEPLRVDAETLESLNHDTLAEALQASTKNPLIGLHQRVKLLGKLGQALRRHPEVFGKGIDARPGHLFDYLKAKAIHNKIPAREILLALLKFFGEIWPNGELIGNTCIGDIGYHSMIHRDDETNKMVPFHKLSQWMAYSLIEPLEDAGITVVSPDALTGLAEYRNGGLFIDTGVLKLKDPDQLTKPHTPDSEIVVEWRALTVALLDRIANIVRAETSNDENTLPLASVLQGGTWAAGRRLANKFRDNGEPPLTIDSDGTVF